MGKRKRTEPQADQAAPSLPERISVESLQYLRATWGDLQRAQQMYAGLHDMLSQTYQLAPKDEIDLGTGVIKRVAQVPPQPDQQG